jgi:hypothetical protein
LTNYNVDYGYLDSFKLGLLVAYSVYIER